jgi:tight adherence protein B
MIIVAFGLAILLGYGAARIVARPPEALVDRVAGFVSVQRPERQAAATVVVSPTVRGPGLLQRLATGRRSTRMERLAATLELADVSIEPMQLILVSIIGTLLVALVLFAAIGAIGFFLGLVGGPLIVRFIIRRRVANKRKAFAEQLPDNLEVMSSALRAGHSLIGALQVVADDAAEPSASEFKRVLAEEQFGAQLEDAFKVAVERMESDDLDQVALVSRLQREMGSNSAEVLDQVIVTVRAKMEIRRTIGTLTAQGRMSRWLLTLLPVVLALMMTLISPKYMHPLYHKTLGEVLLVMAALMVACGSWIIGKIVDIAI